MASRLTAIGLRQLSTFTYAFAAIRGVDLALTLRGEQPSLETRDGKDWKGAHIIPSADEHGHLDALWVCRGLEGWDACLNAIHGNEVTSNADLAMFPFGDNPKETAREVARYIERTGIRGTAKERRGTSIRMTLGGGDT